MGRQPWVPRGDAAAKARGRPAPKMPVLGKTVKLRILGCSGGIGGDLRTTSMLIDSDLLIDAGTGLGTLTLEELSRIDHVFLTHSHLDHIACLPLMVDSVARMRDKPLTVYATLATLSILKGHVFNWSIWPDFTRVPNAERPFMRFETISIGQPKDLGGRTVTPIPAAHVVPAVGFWLDSGQGSLVYTGDTTSNDEFWSIVNEIHNLRYLIIETAFSDAQQAIAIASKHLCPCMLADELKKMKVRPEIYITHMKPGEDDLIMQQIEGSAASHRPKMLKNDQVFYF